MALKFDGVLSRIARGRETERAQAEVEERPVEISQLAVHKLSRGVA